MMYVYILEFSVCADIFHVVRIRYMLSKSATYWKKINKKKKEKKGMEVMRKGSLDIF